MRVTVLADNSAGKGGLQGEAGLSMLIESDKRNYLFDAGLGKLFRKNARLMNIELFGVDLIVLSHGHDDHVGGLPWALHECPRAHLAVHRLAMEHKYSKSTGVLRYVGINKRGREAIAAMDESGGVLWLENKKLKDAGNVIFSTGGRKHFPDGWNFFIEEEKGQDVPDRFADEISLLMNGKHAAALFVGCAHCGVAEIFAAAEKMTTKPIIAVFGGSHLNKAPDEEINAVAEFFSERDTQLFLGHCTGMTGYARLYSALSGWSLHPIHSGFHIDLEL